MTIRPRSSAVGLRLRRSSSSRSPRSAAQHRRAAASTRSLGVLEALTSAPERARRRARAGRSRERVLAPAAGPVHRARPRLTAADPASGSGTSSTWPATRRAGPSTGSSASRWSASSARCVGVAGPLRCCSAWACPSLVVIVLGAVARRLLRARTCTSTRRATTAPSEMQRDLPDAIDLLTISVEAGLGFDAALSQVARNTEGPLAEEFARVLQEMQIGLGRADAMRALGERTNVARPRVVRHRHGAGRRVRHPDRPGAARAVQRDAGQAPAAGRGEGPEGAGEDHGPADLLHPAVPVHRGHRPGRASASWTPSASMSAAPDPPSAAPSQSPQRRGIVALLAWSPLLGAVVTAAAGTRPRSCAARARRSSGRCQRSADRRAASSRSMRGHVVEAACVGVDLRLAPELTGHRSPYLGRAAARHRAASPLRLPRRRTAALSAPAGRGRRRWLDRRRRQLPDAAASSRDRSPGCWPASASAWSAPVLHSRARARHRTRRRPTATRQRPDPQLLDAAPASSTGGLDPVSLAERARWPVRPRRAPRQRRSRVHRPRGDTRHPARYHGDSARGELRRRARTRSSRPAAHAAARAARPRARGVPLREPAPARSAPAGARPVARRSAPSDEPAS